MIAILIVIAAQIVLTRSVFPADEIERERRVILQELGDAADDPESVAQDAFDALAFARQPLGRPHEQESRLCLVLAAPPL